MSEEYEFFGFLDKEAIQDDNHNSLIDWRVTDHTLTVNKTREIEDGDYLEVYDSLGRLKLSKIIYRDYDSFYSETHQRQLYAGMAVAWVPEGISLDFWISLFNNNYRAKIVKEK
jgi:hypothetical protein